MTGFFFHAYVMAVGFVVAGICASLARLVTGRPLAFGVEPAADLAWVPALVVTRAFAGPAIIMRNALTGALREGRATAWLAASTLISALWSFVSGVVVLDLVLRAFA